MTFFAVGVAADFRYAYWCVLATLAGAVAAILARYERRTRRSNRRHVSALIFQQTLEHAARLLDDAVDDRLPEFRARRHGPRR